MSKIFYFTTAQSITDFASSLSLWKKAPNTSNQNFHNKLIRAISLVREVEVISIRPINKYFAKSSLEDSKKVEDKVTWNYIKVKASKVDKFLLLKSRVSSTISNVEKDDVVIVDVLNLSLLKMANSFAKKHQLKIIGVCTDDPRNISFTSSNYSKKVLKIARSLDGYICLTQKLAELFNVNGKKQVIIDGVTEELDLPKEKNQEKYIFFCGSLMHKYGVYNLIKAFESLKLKDIELKICGHHEEDNLKGVVDITPNVEYLGTLSYLELAKIESQALLAVNPRPIDEKIDHYSIPSKTLESLANGVLTVSVNNEILKKNYEHGIIWAESGEVEDLATAISYALSLKDKEKAEIISAGKKIVKSRTSFEIVAHQIEQLL